MAKQNPNKPQQGGQATRKKERSDDRPGNPNPGNPPPGSVNPGQTGTPGGKGKQDAPQNQKR
jgi:hypothetical protein